MKIVHKDKETELAFGEAWQAVAGKELYRDAATDDLRKLVANIERGVPWREAVTRRFGKENPWLTSIVTSPDRDLFFRMHPPAPGGLVLDIGAGWGQTTLPLARTCKVVTVEPTPERMEFIRATAKQDGVAGNIIFLQSDFFEVEIRESFDLIACIGVMEWLPKFRAGEPRAVQMDFLGKVRRMLKPGGKLIIGIENRLGLKYFLGGNDDHIGLPNIAVLDASLAVKRYQAKTGKPLRSFTYSLAEYQAMATEAGFAGFRPYAAFPDYKLPGAILPIDETYEARVLSGDCLRDEHDGCNGSRLPETTQEDLRSHYKSFAAMGISRHFAPSYYLELS